MAARRRINQRELEIENLARRFFGAYVVHDRDVLEDMLADDFRFTSPYDDAIDADTYLQRCWPTNKQIKAVTFKHIVCDGNDVYVNYVLEMVDDRRVENTELFRFVGDKISRIDVYWGAVHDAMGRFVPPETAPHSI
jgi:hypothetical protein